MNFIPDSHIQYNNEYISVNKTHYDEFWYRTAMETNNLCYWSKIAYKIIKNSFGKSH